MSFICYLTFNNPSVLGHEKQGKDKGAKNVLVMSSKAKGIDRLTGRARRSVPAKTSAASATQQHDVIVIDVIVDWVIWMALSTASIQHYRNTNGS